MDTQAGLAVFRRTTSDLRLNNNMDNVFYAYRMPDKRLQYTLDNGGA